MSSTLRTVVVRVKFPHSPILHYPFSSWIEKTVTKTIHCHWENIFFYNSMGLCGSFTTELFSKRFSRLAQKFFKFFTASPVPVRMSGQAFMVITPV